MACTLHVAWDDQLDLRPERPQQRRHDGMEGAQPPGASAVAHDQPPPTEPGMIPLP